MDSNEQQIKLQTEQWLPHCIAQMEKGGRGQDKDGYIHSYHVLRNHQRFTNDADHEFYVMGYFIEMGAAHHRLTGGKDRRLYDAAIRCADYLDATFGPAPKRSWRNGHPGLEYALCRLGVLANAAEGAGKGEKYVSLTRHFYYQNPLESDKARDPWHSCPCCVGNIPRTLFGLKDAMYSTDKARREVFISHFADS